MSDEMQTFKSAMSKGLDALIANATRSEPTDYLKDGITYCGKCHTPKEARIATAAVMQIFGAPHNFPILCDCGWDAEAARLMAWRKEQEEADARQRKQMAFDIPGCSAYTFDADDQQNPVISKALRKYCETADEMIANGMGIALTGDVGSGKTFFAGCIANEMLNLGKTVWMTSLPTIIDALGYGEEKEAVMRRIKRVDYLILDDVGTERATGFVDEKAYEVINLRSQSGKPLIITTNLSKADLTTPGRTASERIFDRIRAMCPIVIPVKGGRRAEIAERKRQLAKYILQGGDE